MSAAAPHPPATGADGSGRGDTVSPASAPSGGQPAPGQAEQAGVGEACPLCGAPLAPEQDWCLRCGGAARTRLAASPRWTAPIIALATVAVLSLGVLAAALVSLAGSPSPRTGPATTTVTIPAVTVTPTASVPAVPAPGTATGATSATGVSGPTSSTSATGATRATGATSATGASPAAGGATARSGATSAATGKKALLSPAQSKRLLEQEEAARRKG